MTRTDALRQQHAEIGPVQQLAYAKTTVLEGLKYAEVKVPRSYDEFCLTQPLTVDVQRRVQG